MCRIHVSHEFPLYSTEVVVKLSIYTPFPFGGLPDVLFFLYFFFGTSPYFYFKMTCVGSKILVHISDC